MIVKRCDRCGMIFEHKSNMSNGINVVTNSYNDECQTNAETHNLNNSYYDICSGCIRDFSKWLEFGGKTNEKR